MALKDIAEAGSSGLSDKIKVLTINENLEIK